jgi:hypothetical protein
MVFRIPPPPPKNVDSVGKRHVAKLVKNINREGVREALAASPRIKSQGTDTPGKLKEATTGRHGYANNPPADGVQWPGHVVDPAWMKANPSTVASTKTVQDWRDFIFTGIEETMTDRFNPKQIRGDNNARVVPCMWTPLTHDFIEGLAYIIDRILMEPEFRDKIQVIPGGKVDPQPVIGINELREVLAPDLETLLAALQQTVVDGIDSAKDKLIQEQDTMIIRSVWETDIRDSTLSSDVTHDEILAEGLESMDNIEFEQEANRRGYRIVPL